MSKQLAISTALSVLAMLAFALFASPSVSLIPDNGRPRVGIDASGQALPQLRQFLPALQ